MSDEAIRKYTIVGAVRETERIAVTIELFENVAGEEHTFRTIHAFPLDAEKEHIEAEVEKYAKTYFEDRDRARANAVQDEAAAKADATIESLTGNSTNL